MTLHLDAIHEILPWRQILNTNNEMEFASILILILKADNICIFFPIQNNSLLQHALKENLMLKQLGIFIFIYCRYLNLKTDILSRLAF